MFVYIKYLVYAMGLPRSPRKVIDDRDVITADRALIEACQSVNFCNCPLHCSFSRTVHNKHISAICLYFSCFDDMQGLYQMLEDKVSIRCRQKDEKLLNVITSCIS